VSAIKLPLVLFSFFSSSKFGYQCFHLFDVLSLCGFISSTEQDDQSDSILQFLEAHRPGVER